MPVAKRKKKAKAKAKAVRKCGVCGEEGHNKRSCPDAAASEAPASLGPADEEEPSLEEEVGVLEEVTLTKKQVKTNKEHQSEFDKFVALSKKAWPNTTMVAEEAPNYYLPRISTGNLGLDIATFGGWPRGRISRVFGREKSAKSGSCWNTVVCWQHQHCGACYEPGPCEHGSQSGVDRPKAKALWIDAENRVQDMWYWPEGHGVDLSALLVQAPPSGQHITDFVDSAIRTHGAGIGLIVVDSVANFTSQEEIDKATIKGRTMAVNASLLNRALRKWIAAVNFLGVKETKKPTILLINQLRKTMDQYRPEEQPGGEAQKYATSIDVRFSRKKEHYIVVNEDGEIEDKVKAFGSRWNPPKDETPYYVEIDYRVTSSGICPNGRLGQFNYWTREGHGRRLGDPDNVERMWEYIKHLKFLQKEKKGWSLFGIHKTTQNAVKNEFFASPLIQATAWREIVSSRIDNKKEGEEEESDA